MTDSFIYKGIQYFIEDDKYYRFRYGKKLNVSKKEYEKLRKKADGSIQRD
jgi:hypothetical protein